MTTVGDYRCRLEIDPNETPVGTIGGHVRNLRPTDRSTGNPPVSNRYGEATAKSRHSPGTPLSA